MCLHVDFGRSFSKIKIYDVRMFNPNAPSCKSCAISSCYKLTYKRRNVAMKKGETNRSCLFTPLVFFCTGGANTLPSTFLERLGSLLSLKQALSTVYFHQLDTLSHWLCLVTRIHHVSQRLQNQNTYQQRHTLGLGRE